MASPSWLATQPPTPITRSGRNCFRCLTRPRSWNTFSWAFSRTEQVLNRMMSASSGWSVLTMPPSTPSTSAILSESYSFIWHPKVRMNSFLTIRESLGPGQSARGGFLGGQDPDAEHGADLVGLVAHGNGSLQRAGHDDQVAFVAHLQPRRQRQRVAVDPCRSRQRRRQHTLLGLLGQGPHHRRRFGNLGRLRSATGGAEGAADQGGDQGTERHGAIIGDAPGAD